jgi:hypothetical protein
MLWRNTNGDTALWNTNGSDGFTFQDLGVVGTSWHHLMVALSIAI